MAIIGKYPSWVEREFELTEIVNALYAQQRDNIVKVEYGIKNVIKYVYAPCESNPERFTSVPEVSTQMFIELTVKDVGNEPRKHYFQGDKQEIEKALKL